MKRWIFLVSAIMLFLLTACSDDSGDENSGKSENDTERTIKIEDGIGEKTIKGTPKKIVVLEWFYAEHLLALGIQPAGVPNIDEYNKWINIDEELADSVQDVGTRQEPNLEAISRLNPDLIIAAKFRHGELLDQLNKIAPTVTFAPYGNGSENLHDEMMNEFKTIAKIVDKEDKAKQEIADLNAFYDEQKERVAELGMDGKEYIATLAFSVQNSPVLRLYTDNSIVAQVMKRLGFKNAYQTEKPEQYGFSEVGIEALQNFQKDNLQFLYIVQEDDNVFENQLKENPVWENLSFVKSGNVHQIPGDTPVFGGVLSAKVLADQLITSMQEE
ncbi:ABC transporter substrate-binding protein [Virgibacillus dakarensis]|uniref:Ferrichrome ABC transporter substrate-binding protein n=1 Tax=Lentibacillus populi TaxID=1827502 RepID=A0A9W5U244_9BACI|nr:MULTISPECIES: iron-siderophore ABC transporter substrate-binding protein [Bacillaceae]MBT2218494.1 ABC transporter substrate-binding protein [Virgibacillus dakarensis]MTW86682.1 ABC transporter substrate-binding protein [Virgibacillus dakarensis]GGB62629.1 ferrichrome ABC transporter substrate-binding protein [Lentibacillus populi]